MPIVFPPSGPGYTNTQTAKGGITITAGGTAHTMGAWTTVLSNLAFDCHALFLNVFGIRVGTGTSRYLLDIGVSDGKSGSERVIIPYLDAGAAAMSNEVGKTYLFPIYIRAGSSLIVRGQSETANKTCTVVAHAIGLPFHGYSDYSSPQVWVQYGANPSTSSGTALTSGNGAFGTAALIGTTSQDHRLWHVGIDWATNTAISTGRYRVRLSTDSAGNDVIGIWEFTAPSTAEDIAGPAPVTPMYRPLPSGTSLYVACDGAAAEAMAAIVYAA